MKGRRRHTGAFLSPHPALQLVSPVAQSCPALCDPMDCSMPGLPVHHQHPELAQTPVHRVSDATEPPHPLSSPSPPAFNLSQHQGLFQWVSSLHQVAKYWSFSSNISPSNEYSGLVSFRMDWLDLLAVQGTLRSLLQHHSSVTSVLPVLRCWSNLCPFHSHHSCFYYYYWSWISLQHRVGFCCPAAWVGCKYAHTPSSDPLPAPPLEVITEQSAELPGLHRTFPLAVYFVHGSVYKSVLLKAILVFGQIPLDLCWLPPLGQGQGC